MHAFIFIRQVCAAVVTCGGLCPGLNDVIQNIVYTLRDYGVPEDNILGIKWVVCCVSPTLACLKVAYVCRWPAYVAGVHI
jgi:hypothetical protein